MAMANPNYAKLSAAQRAELKAAKLSAANQATAAAQTAADAQRLAGGITGLSMAARAGGKIIDTSAAEGVQSPVATQTAAYLRGTVQNPFVGMRQAALRNKKRVNDPYFKRKFGNALINDYASAIKDVKTAGGSGSTILGGNLLLPTGSVETG
jgi:hypothetical protein